MSFVSLPFFLFIILLVPLYYLPFRKVQWQFLLAASFVFYMYSGWMNFIYISVTILTTYLATMYMERLRTKALPKPEIKKRRRNVMTACLILNLGILAVFKYSPLSFPLGLSFYTLQTMGYLIDCYRSKDASFTERNIFKLALFTSFFPQLIQGPISRFGDLRQTLYGGHRMNYGDFSAGITRALFGLFKKIVIADRLMPVMETYPALAVFLYAAVIYCDFTGGIDMTIGVARMLGIKLAENFDYPFYSKSAAEYWRRWHMTMGGWFRDYIFYPLSISKPMRKLIKPSQKLLGSNVGKRVPVWVATMATWLATGIWHGASWNFVVWGLLNGFIILVSQELTPLYKKFHSRFPALTASKPYAAFQIARTFCLTALIRGLDLFSISGTDSKMGLAEWLVCAAGIGVLILAGFVHRKKPDAFQGPIFRLCACLVLILAVLVFGVYGTGYDISGFIYTKF